MQHKNAATAGLLVFVGAAVVISGIVLLARPQQQGGSSAGRAGAVLAPGRAPGAAGAGASASAAVKSVTWVKRKLASGAFVGWDTRVDAQAACYNRGLALCTRDELAAATYSNCETGWTAEGQPGWWRATAASGCGRAGWNDGGGDAFGAYCCGPNKGSPVSFETWAGGIVSKTNAEAACKAAPGGRTALCPTAQIEANKFSGCTIGWAKDGQGWWRDVATDGCGGKGWNSANAADAGKSTWGAFCCTPCPAGYHFATAEEGVHITTTGVRTGWCVPNKCWCKDGTGATGLACTSQDAEICGSCDPPPKGLFGQRSTVTSYVLVKGKDGAGPFCVERCNNGADNPSFRLGGRRLMGGYCT